MRIEDLSRFSGKHPKVKLEVKKIFGAFLQTLFGHFLE